MHHIRTKPERFHYVSPEARADISHEKAMITRALKYLDIACKQLKRIEDDLSQFLSEYYARVGAWFEELETLRAQTAAVENSPAELPSDHPKAYSLSDASSAMLEQEMKSIYRGLAKIYHPDAASEHQNTEIIKHINAAYARKSINELRRLEYQVLEEGVHNDAGDSDQLTRLKQRYESIVASITHVNHRRKTLLECPAYSLKQRVYNAKLLGYDLISVIETDTKAQIEECKAKLDKAVWEADFKKKFDVVKDRPAA